MELCALQAVCPSPPKKIAFIGSGPLPLSAICLSQNLEESGTSNIPEPGLPSVLNIDKVPDAISQSRILVEKLGATKMYFSCQEIGRSDLDLRSFDVVFLAALVGETQEEKEKLLISVVRSMREGALVVIRTAHGLRQLLYPVNIQFSQSFSRMILVS
jgi:nicotianamine synthase